MDQLIDASQRLLDTVLRALYVAYIWAREWQPLLAGLLVVFAALIVSRAIFKTTAPRALQSRATAKESSQPDLRQRPKSAATAVPVAPDELVGSLEQLRSLIRSAMASFALTAEKENSPAHFLCQRIAHLGLERIALPSSASKTAREFHAILLEQLELFRAHLKRDAPSSEISDLLVQMNSSARNLTAALIPLSDKRRQAKSDPL